jgi:hypothetical protein
MNSTPPPETMKVLNPRLDARGELLRRHAAVRRGHDPEDGLLALRERALHVSGEERLVGLLRLPLGVPGRHRLHLVEREGELEVDRLLGPEHAVVVEDGDTLGRLHEPGALARHLGHELEDRLLRLSVVPRRKRDR